MTFDKCQQAMGECAVTIRAFLANGHSAHQARDLAHCLSMVRQCAQELGPEREEKATLWLGFIQGIMYAHGVADVEALKGMNRTREEVCGRPSDRRCLCPVQPCKEHLD